MSAADKSHDLAILTSAADQLHAELDAMLSEDPVSRDWLVHVLRHGDVEMLRGQTDDFIGQVAALALAAIIQAAIRDKQQGGEPDDWIGRI